MIISYIDGCTIVALLNIMMWGRPDIMVFGI